MLVWASSFTFSSTSYIEQFFSPGAASITIRLKENWTWKQELEIPIRLSGYYFWILRSLKHCCIISIVYIKVFPWLAPVAADPPGQDHCQPIQGDSHPITQQVRWTQTILKLRTHVITYMYVHTHKHAKTHTHTRSILNLWHYNCLCI